MADPTSSSEVTVVVVPRQRFSVTKLTLETLHACTPAEVPLVYVDGGSPNDVRSYLEAQARERGFTLVRTDHYLTPNEARNLGLRIASSRYVVFVDNDVVVAPGWLDWLVACAEETGAWVVGPLVCIGEPPFQTVHIAGGSVRLDGSEGGYRLVDRHRFTGRPLAEVAGDLERAPCGFVEFHCMLVRRDVFDRVGLLDERLQSAAEHLDFCLLVGQAGGAVYVEPRARVNYLPARRLPASDVGFYMLRWSDVWNRRTLAHLRAKWRLDPDDPFLAGHYMWLTNKRMLILGRAWALARQLAGWRRSLWLGRVFERAVTRPIVSRGEARRARAQAADRQPARLNAPTLTGAAGPAGPVTPGLPQNPTP